MDIKNIDEAERLIEKFRDVQAAKAAKILMAGEDGGDSDSFVLVERDSGLEIELPRLKSDVLDSIESVLNDQYDKIIARLREI